MAPDATGDAPPPRSPAVFRVVAKDYLRPLGGRKAGEPDQREERAQLGDPMHPGRRRRDGGMRRHRGGHPAEGVRRTRSADAFGDVERRKGHHPQRRAVRRGGGITGGVQRRRHPRRRGRRPSGRPVRPRSADGLGPAGMGQRDGQQRRLGPRLPEQSIRVARRRRASTASRSRGARPSTRPPRSRQRRPLLRRRQRGLAGGRRLLRVRAERVGGLEPGRHESRYRRRPRRRRPGVTADRRRRMHSSRAARSAR